MVVEDVLSRCQTARDEHVSSPNEEDPYLPYNTEKLGVINLPPWQDLSDLLKPSDSDTNIKIVQHIVMSQTVHLPCDDDGYDADTDDTEPYSITEPRRFHKRQMCVPARKLKSTLGLG